MSEPAINLEVLRLGRRPFQEVWELQKSLQQLLIQGEGRETLILCEHDSVITVGTSAHEENILIPRQDLEDCGIRVYDIERGGDVTWHGPGQIVGYPIMDLKRHKTDVHWYMRSLEQVIIDSLSVFGIKGIRSQGKTGVWVETRENSAPFKEMKIASMGVRLSKWISLHGFSLNVRDCSEGFSLINPCGFQSAEITWMEREIEQELDLGRIQDELEISFERVFFSDSGL